MFIRFRRADPLERLVDLAIYLETMAVRAEWGQVPAKPEDLVEIEEEAFRAFEEGRLTEGYARELRSRAEKLARR